MAAPSKGRPWTKDEDARLFALRAEGKNYWQIAESIGRTFRAVQARLSYHKTPWAERAEQNRVKHATRKPRDRKTVQLCAKSGYVKNIPIEVLIDRDRRLLAERSITAAFCGDPVFPSAPNNPRVLA